MFRCIGTLNTGHVRSVGSRRDIDLQCLLRSIADSHNYSAPLRLPRPASLGSPSFFLPLSSTLAPRFSPRAPPLLLAITNTDADTLYVFSFSLSLEGGNYKA